MPGVVVNIVLVVKNMTDVMSPPIIPAFGLKNPAMSNTAAVISLFQGFFTRRIADICEQGNERGHRWSEVVSGGVR